MPKTFGIDWASCTTLSVPGLKYGPHAKIETFVALLPVRAKAARRIVVNLTVIAIVWLLVREVGKVIDIGRLLATGAVA